MTKESTRVSLKDVASAVGVSPALVSVVLNEKGKQYRVSEKMITKIKEVAKEMHYTPNETARNLRRGKSDLIGLIVPDISNPFYSAIARVIENRSHDLGYTLVFGSSDETPTKLKQWSDVLLSKGVDGLIIVPTEGCEAELDALNHEKIPIVFLDRTINELYSYVGLNNIEAAKIATQYLIDNGKTNIAFIVYDSQLSDMKNRIIGYEQAMGDLPKHIITFPISASKEKISEDLHMHLYKDNFDGVVFATSRLTLYGMHTIQRNSTLLMKEMTVVGFDGNDLLDMIHPAISYIKQPANEIGMKAVELIVEMIKEGKSAAPINKHEFSPIFIKH